MPAPTDDVWCSWWVVPCHRGRFQPVPPFSFVLKGNGVLGNWGVWIKIANQWFISATASNFLRLLCLFLSTQTFAIRQWLTCAEFLFLFQWEHLLNYSSQSPSSASFSSLPPYSVLWLSPSPPSLSLSLCWHLRFSTFSTLLAFHLPPSISASPSTYISFPSSFAIHFSDPLLLVLHAPVHPPFIRREQTQSHQM